MTTSSPPTLFEAFVSEFTQRRPGLLVLDEAEGKASIAERAPGFGPIEIQDDGSELTVSVGRFTHCHFEMFEAEGDATRQREVAVTEAIDFVEEILDDRLACHGSHDGGGGCMQVGKPVGLLSRLLGPRFTYTWSGCIYDQRWKKV